MQGIVEILRVFAQQEETILLGGPTGAGKSRLARWCHERSPASGKQFETIDLATVPEELQVAELFGWKKGAFTGAVRDTQGCIARAEGGTLFIDEVDKLSLKAQAGLLRVLEEKRYRPLGDGAPDRNANVRFIIGTNADLLALSHRGVFRADLYYRINVLPVRIPPLRERPDEIVEWASYMVRRRHEASKAGGEAIIDPDAAKLLNGHDWPGNLRQLDNIVRRAYALSLVDYGTSPERVVLRAEHIGKAFMYEGRGAPLSLFEYLERAAAAFVTEAERRAEWGEEKLDLALADAFKGLVIEAAKRRFGADEKEALRRAFVLLGKGSTVEGRNHWATYKREMEKVNEARRAFERADSLTSNSDSS
jgi:DNA-binding NtrC family response regulator